MATVREIVGRALTRLRILAPGEALPAHVAQTGLDALNAMLADWQTAGIYMPTTTYALTDTFWMVVPPIDITSETISALSYQGTWNASTNTPILASATGTEGYAYRVSVAGTTTLDGIASWAVDGSLIFNGKAWVRGLDTNRLHRGVIELLAVEVAPEFGRAPSEELRRSAVARWRNIQALFIKPATPVFDGALVNTFGNRRLSSLDLSEA